jgi:glutamate-1-semialdehyde 2,1-aminomutase
VAAGGATEKLGVAPDLVTLAKALGYGLPSGAIGGTEEAMAAGASGRVLPGRDLQRARATARASLEEVPTSGAYAHLNALNDRLIVGCDRVLAETGLPGYAVGVSPKGCVTFSPTKIVDYASFMATQDPELPHLAWLSIMNRGSS